MGLPLARLVALCLALTWAGGAELQREGRTRNHGHNVCSTWGDFHYKTFDGDVFRFPGLCDYNFASDCRDAYKEFAVHLRRGPGGSGGPSQVEYILLTVKDDTIYLTQQLVVVNGAMVSTPHYSPGLLIERSAVYTKVYSRAGLALVWNREDSVMLELDSKFQNHTCGLCGDYNGLQTYSEFLSEGIPFSPLEFGNMQKINKPEEKCDDPEEAQAKLSCSEHRAECERLLTDVAFEDCQGLVPLELYVQACVQDRCQCPQGTSCVCSTIAEFSRQCSHAGGRPGNWRTAKLCPKSCPGNMVYLESSSPCVDTCSHLEVSSLCEEHRMDGCFCPEGTVYDDIAGRGCIPVSQCHCKLHGHQYAPGQQVTNNCEQCVCNAGRWVCQDLQCPGACALEGGSHITTFDGRKYTFHGDCYYVLTKGTHNDSYAILGELTPCGSTDKQTCLKTVVLLADNKKNVVLFKSDGSVLLNELQVNLPHVTASFSIFQPSSHHLLVDTAFGLRLQVQLAPMMQLFLTLDQAAQGRVQGLCGNFNGLEGDDFKTAGGLVEATGAGFANTWKAQSSCHDKVDWLDDPCSLNIESANYAEHWCSLLKKTGTPFGRCHSAVDPAEYYKRCKYDTCNCQNTEDCLCAALSSYARACAAKGIMLWGWREHVCNKDVGSCPQSQIFRYNLTTCQQTCRSLSEADAHCLEGFAPVDGCGCPDQTFLDEKGRCVPLAKCSCYHRGLYLEAGEVVLRQEERCVCRSGRLHCVPVKLLGQSCEAPKIHVDCNNLTALAIRNPRPVSCQTLAAGYYQTECVSGCVCPEGLIDDGRGGCVVEEACPCVHNEDLYSPGDRIRVDCNTCTCRKGRWACTQSVCHGTCAIYGSGHYITFDGKYYDFDGHCSYVAVQDYCGQKSPQGSFSIITENVPCGTTGVTCSKAIKIFLGRTELKLEDKHRTVIQRDVGHHVAYTTREVGQYLVVEASVGVIVIWDKKTTVFIKLAPSYKGTVCGLCGNFDQRSNNDFTTRDHMVVDSELDFGNSWKEASACPDVSTIPVPCSLNPHRRSWAEKQCSLIKSKVFRACHSKVDPKPFYEACVHDSCSCDTGGDCECFCSAVASYAQECTKEGACVFWRTPDLCPIFCDYYNPPDECEWHYEPCGNRSFETCRTINGIHSNISVSYLEGCYPRCPKNRPIFDEDRKKCVPADKCGCYLEDIHYPPGASVPPEHDCQACLCTASSQVVCWPEEGKIVNYTQDGSFCYWEICGPNGTLVPHFNVCVSTPSTPTTSPTTALSPLSLCCVWSDWINDHHPSGDSDGGDHETFDHVCRAPQDIQCRAATEPHLGWTELDQEAQCNISFGFICKNEDQFGKGPFGLCYDYEIRVYCCLPMEECPTTTPPTPSSSTPTVPTTTPILPTTTPTPPPSTTSTTPPTTTPFPPTTSTTPPTTTPISTPPSTTSTTPPTTTPFPPTTTPTPPTTTPTPSPPSTTSTTPPTTTPFPPTTSTTPPTTTPTPTPLSTTSTTPPPTSTSTSTPPPVSTTTVTPCLPQCKWTGWLDSGKPSFDKTGGDFESLEDICELGWAADISCRAAMYPSVPIQELGQTVLCNTSVGLVCRNQDQKPGGAIPLPYCLNYEINVYCCELLDGTTSTTPPTTTPFPPTPSTTPPTTTPISIPLSTTSTTPLTTTPIPPTTTHTPPTTTPISTPPSTTSTTPPTTTPISPTTTPTPPTTTPISTPLSTTSTSPPTTTPILPTTTPVPTTTTPTPSPPSTTFTTPPTTTSIPPTPTLAPTTTTPISTLPTTISTPLTTTSTTLPPTSTSASMPPPVSTTTMTPPTPCLPQCKWTGWVDSDKPNVNKTDGDFESLENICELGWAADISCRAAMLPRIPIQELGQTVVCNTSVGLVCRNQDQKPVGASHTSYCLNYEINVYCCDLPDYCVFTSSTTTAETPTTSPTTTSTETSSSTPTTTVTLTPTPTRTSTGTPTPASTTIETTVTETPTPTPTTTSTGTPTPSPTTTSTGPPTPTPTTTSTGTPPPTPTTSTGTPTPSPTTTSTRTPTPTPTTTSTGTPTPTPTTTSTGTPTPTPTTTSTETPTPSPTTTSTGTPTPTPTTSTGTPTPTPTTTSTGTPTPSPTTTSTGTPTPTPTTTSTGTPTPTPTTTSTGTPTPTPTTTSTGTPTPTPTTTSTGTPTPTPTTTSTGTPTPTPTTTSTGTPTPTPTTTSTGTPTPSPTTTSTGTPTPTPTTTSTGTPTPSPTTTSTGTPTPTPTTTSTGTPTPTPTTTSTGTPTPTPTTSTATPTPTPTTTSTGTPTPTPTTTSTGTPTPSPTTTSTGTPTPTPTTTSTGTPTPSPTTTSTGTPTPTPTTTSTGTPTPTPTTTSTGTPTPTPTTSTATPTPTPTTTSTGTPTPTPTTTSTGTPTPTPTTTSTGTPTPTPTTTSTGTPTPTPTTTSTGTPTPTPTTTSTGTPTPTPTTTSTGTPTPTPTTTSTGTPTPTPTTTSTGTPTPTPTTTSTGTPTPTPTTTSTGTPTPTPTTTSTGTPTPTPTTTSTGTPTPTPTTTSTGTPTPSPTSTSTGTPTPTPTTTSTGTPTPSPTTTSTVTPTPTPTSTSTIVETFSTPLTPTSTEPVVTTTGGATSSSPTPGTTPPGTQAARSQCGYRFFESLTWEPAWEAGCRAWVAAATSWGSGTWASVSWSLRGPAPHGWRQPQAPPAGELVYNGTHGDTCYYVNCSLDCNLEFFNWSCPSTPTTQPPTTPSVPATSKPLPACPDFDPPRQENETWWLCNCTMATCKYNNTVELVEVKCDPPPMPTCSNGLAPVRVMDPNGCCWHWECDCYCTGWGDPHYVTFDGLYYSYQGNCTYVLVEEATPTVDNFGVYIDNYHCDVNDQVSCPRTLIVRHETQEVLLKTVHMMPVTVQVQVNRQVVALPYKKYGLQVYESGINYVVDIPDLGALISYNGLSFSVRLPYRLFGNNTKGQCGTCTNTTADDCVLPSGEVTDDCEVAADQWVVNDPSKPHCPHISFTTRSPATSPPVGRGTTARKDCASPLCELIKDSLFAECHALAPPQHYYEACMFDSCFVPNSGLECASLQTYAALCAQEGICVDWRNHTHGACPVTCPAHREYRACGPAEEPTCKSSPSQQNSTRLVEGCFCPEGTMNYAPGFDVCVDFCGCVGPDNVPREFGEHFEFDCKHCLCLEGGSGITCRPKTCAPEQRVECREDGTYPVREVDPLDTCCNVTSCKCNASLCREQPPLCPLGFQVKSQMVPGRCCPRYSEVRGGRWAWPGSPVYSSKCQNCICTDRRDNATQLNVISCTHVPCNTSCNPGFELVDAPGECCKKCQQTQCVINLPDNQKLVLKPGDRKRDSLDNCTFFSCVKAHDQLISSVSSITCPDFDPSTCLPGSVTLMRNGCCRKCIPRNETRVACSTISVVREISYDGCTALVTMNDCSGSCGTFAMYSAQAQSLDHKCSCCKEYRTSQREVTLQCPDGGTLSHTYTHIESCLCQDTVCQLPSQRRTRRSGPRVLGPGTG
uniref:Mucin-2 n=1 Tax=Sus scrofa TaxID=9823 RepID=A0A8D0NLT5_PIG